MKVSSLFVEFHMVSLCAWHFTFYGIGYIVHMLNIQKNLDKKCHYGYLAIGCLLFECAAYGGNLNSGIYPVQIILNYVVTLVMVVGIYGITKLLSEKLKKRFRILSVYSMYIYILHFFLLQSYVSNAYCNIIIESVAGVVIPIFVAWIIHKFDWKVKVLFGE